MSQRFTTISYGLTQNNLNQLIQQYEAEGFTKPEILQTLGDCKNDIQAFQQQMNSKTPQLAGRLPSSHIQLQSNIKFTMSRIPTQLKSQTIITTSEQMMFNYHNLQDQFRPNLAIPAGLINLGNSCYFNIILQSLYNFIPFRHLILYLELPKNQNPASNFLSSARKLFAMLGYGNKKYLDPSDLLKYLSDYKPNALLNAAEQNDYNEALILLLDVFEEALKDTKNEKQSKDFHTMFYGQSEEKLSVALNLIRTTQSEFTSISVEPKQQTLTQAFRESCILKVENYLPGQTATIVSTILKPPILLYFHINRVSYNIQIQDIVKNNGKFSFVEQIDINEMMQQNSAIKSQELRSLEQQQQDLLNKITRCGSDEEINSEKLLQLVGKAPYEAFLPGSQLKPIILKQQVELFFNELQKVKASLNDKYSQVTTQIEKIRKKQDQNNVFSLVGVLIHSGSAQYGHYYCYLKTGTGWWKYNDRIVSSIDFSTIYRDSQGEIIDSNNVCGLIYCKDYANSLAIPKLDNELNKFVEMEKETLLTNLDKEIVISLKSCVLAKCQSTQSIIQRKGISGSLQYLVYPESQIMDPGLKNEFLKLKIFQQEIDKCTLNYPTKKGEYLKYFFENSMLFKNPLEVILQQTQKFAEQSNRILSLQLEGTVKPNNYIQTVLKFQNLLNYVKETQMILSQIKLLYNAILLQGIFFIDFLIQISKIELVKKISWFLFQIINKTYGKNECFILPIIREQILQHLQNGNVVNGTFQAESQILQCTTGMQDPVDFLNALNQISIETELWQSFVNQIDQNRMLLSEEERLKQETPKYPDYLNK